jgi:YD repeat-containing protein
VGHYSALLSDEEGIYRFEDPTFGSPDTHFTVSRPALDAEASGYMLIPAGPLPPGYTVVTAEEGEKVWGKGLTSGPDSSATSDDDLDCGCGGESSAGPGMMVASAHLMVTGLKLRDTPVGYRPPVGPAIEFTFAYNQREASQPTTLDYGNTSPQWMHSYLSFIDEVRTGSGPYTYTPAVRLLGGGTEMYGSTGDSATDLVSHAFSTPQIKSQAVLAKVDVNTYQRTELDGSKLVYGYRTGSAGSRRYFLSRIVDTFGNTVVLDYDMSDRLVSITDAIGQVTTLDYEDMSDSLLLTKVTDPFGRYCTIAYDGSGRLSAITDVIGLTSTVTYDSSSTFVTSLTTPYGTSTFDFGENSNSRWLTLTDPLGQTERLEYYGDNTSAPGAGDLPSGMLVTSDNSRFRNTF